MATIRPISLDACQAQLPCLPGGAPGTALLDAAVELCEQFCGRKFATAAVTNERGRTVRDDAPGETRHYIYLARPPITGLASVYLDEAQIGSDFYELVSDGGRAERIFIKTYEDKPGYATRVSYTGGWAAGAAPAGLVVAVATLMGRLQDRLGQGAVGSESSGGENASYLGVGAMYGEIRTMLKPYKLMRL